MRGLGTSRASEAPIKAWELTSMRNSITCYTVNNYVADLDCHRTDCGPFIWVNAVFGVVFRRVCVLAKGERRGGSRRQLDGWLAGQRFSGFAGGEGVDGAGALAGVEQLVSDFIFN